MISVPLILVIVYLLCNRWQLKQKHKQEASRLHLKLKIVQGQKARMANQITQLTQVAANASKPVHYSISKTQRVAIPPSIKNRLKRWYNNSCAYCGVGVTKSTRTIDHIIPLKHGGSNDISNLCISCKDCNRKKGHNFIGWHPRKDPPKS